MPINTGNIRRNFDNIAGRARVVATEATSALTGSDAGLQRLASQAQEAAGRLSGADLTNLTSALEQGRINPLSGSADIQQLQNTIAAAGAQVGAGVNPNANVSPSSLPSANQPRSGNVPSQSAFTSLSPRPYFPVQTTQDRYDFYAGRKVLPEQVLGPLVGSRNFSSQVDPLDRFGGTGRFSENDSATGTPPDPGTTTYEAATGSSSGRVEIRLGGATRNKPLTQKLMDILDAAATEAGVDLVVFSGGQDAKGTPNARRIGSTRHDNGRACDVWVYDNGTQIGTSRSSPIMQKFIASCVKNGALGIGAGPGYMGSVGVHVDHVGGADGGAIMWGEGSSSATTPSWVVAAYRAGERGEV